MSGSNLFSRNPNFAKLWIGQILSQSCGRMFQIAMVWWLLTTIGEGKGVWVGAFMVMAAIPSLILVHWIGKIIDTCSRKKILVTCDLLACLFLLLFAALLNALPPFIAIGASFISALFQAFIDPSLNKAVSEVTLKEDTESAVGLLASTQSIASFSGAILGASLIDHLGVGGTVGMAAVGYLISSLATTLAVFQIENRTTDDSSESLVAGWSLLNTFPLLKKILIGFAAVNFFATPILVVLPIYVKSILHLSARALGALEACIWLGLMSGSWVSSRIQPKQGILPLASLCLGIFGLALAVPGIVVSPIAYGIGLCIAGVFLGINNAKFMNYFQVIVPVAIKGRFFALMQATISITFPVAYFLFGVLTDVIPVMTVCLIQSGGVILTAGYFNWLAKTESRETLGAAA